jgi:hypothetical protein
MPPFFLALPLRQMRLPLRVPTPVNSHSRLITLILGPET